MPMAQYQQWLGQTSQELVTARNQRDTALQQLEKATKHKDLVRLEALEDAVILKMAKLSVGSVLKEGDPLLYLAPLDSPVEAEVHIATRDVGFIRPGDPVMVKLDAFNFIEHGMAEGTLRWISEGAFTVDDNGAPADPYYKARVALTHTDLRNVPEWHQRRPGPCRSVALGPRRGRAGSRRGPGPYRHDACPRARLRGRLRGGAALVFAGRRAGRGGRRIWARRALCQRFRG